MTAAAVKIAYSGGRRLDEGFLVNRPEQAGPDQISRRDRGKVAAKFIFLARCIDKGRDCNRQRLDHAFRDVDLQFSAGVLRHACRDGEYRQCEHGGAAGEERAWDRGHFSPL